MNKLSASYSLENPMVKEIQPSLILIRNITFWTHATWKSSLTYILQLLLLKTLKESLKTASSVLFKPKPQQIICPHIFT